VVRTARQWWWRRRVRREPRSFAAPLREPRPQRSRDPSRNDVALRLCVPWSTSEGQCNARARRRSRSTAIRGNPQFACRHLPKIARGTSRVCANGEPARRRREGDECDQTRSRREPPRAAMPIASVSALRRWRCGLQPRRPKANCDGVASSAGKRLKIPRPASAIARARRATPVRPECLACPCSA
jgi:hypothetical protein